MDTFDVTFWEIKAPINKLDEVKKEFGDNIPNYFTLEGGNFTQNPTTIFCVKSSVDVKNILNKYDFVSHTLHHTNVPKNKYNANFTARISYNRENPYILM